MIRHSKHASGLGLTLIEVLIAVGLIGVVFYLGGTFLVTASARSDQVFSRLSEQILADSVGHSLRRTLIGADDSSYKTSTGKISFERSSGKTTQQTFVYQVECQPHGFSGALSSRLHSLTQAMTMGCPLAGTLCGAGKLPLIQATMNGSSIGKWPKSLAGLKSNEPVAIAVCDASGWGDTQTVKLVVGSLSKNGHSIRYYDESASTKSRIINRNIVKVIK